MRISNLLRTGKPSLSFEFFPPKTEEGNAVLLRTIDRLAAVHPDFVSITYGAGGTTRLLSFDLCCRVMAHTSADVMAHLTGVGHTSDEVDQVADALWSQGIVNVMALRGDVPSGLDLDAAFQHFRFGKDLVKALKSRHDFSIGSGCYPEGHTETPDIRLGVEHLREKVDAGCDFLVTQMFFDPSSYFSFIDLCLRAGITVPIVPGIMPVTGVAQLDRFESTFAVRLPVELRKKVLEHEGDESAIAAVGVDWAVRQCDTLIKGGAPGIHFYTLNRSSATVQVCRELGLTQSSQDSSGSDRTGKSH